MLCKLLSPFSLLQQTYRNIYPEAICYVCTKSLYYELLLLVNKLFSLIFLMFNPKFKGTIFFTNCDHPSEAGNLGSARKASNILSKFWWSPAQCPTFAVPYMQLFWFWRKKSRNEAGLLGGMIWNSQPEFEQTTYRSLRPAKDPVLSSTFAIPLLVALFLGAA